ncbi:MAG TPA: DUF6364 family protein [Bryobacteraceae bacterium]|nr:DUF6364 family protein [Bryobacteraceae bacterium]
MPKLTLSIDENVVSRAKHYARQRDTSVSKLVEDFLDVVSKPAGKASVEAGDAPILRALQGTLRKADRRTYKQHLIKKYR